MGCDETVFGPLVEQLSCRDGISTVVADVSRGRTVAHLAEHALAATPDPFVLVGFSMGGYVAIDMAITAPHRILGLIILGSSARADPQGLAQTRRESEHRVAGGGIDAVAATTAEALVGPEATEREHLVRVVRDMMVAVGPDTYVRHSHAVRTRSDRRKQIAGLEAPVLSLGGELDTAVPARLRHEVAGLVRDGTAETIPGAGHMLPLEQPSEVSFRIVRFIETCRLGLNERP